MDDKEGFQVTRRRSITRIGICILNIVHPGLGLIRLQRYKTGFSFIVLNFAIFFTVIAVYWGVSQISYNIFVALFAFVFAGVLTAFGGSLILTWRWSAEFGSRKGWLWRWYGILGLWLVLSALFSPFLGLAEGSYRNFYLPASSMAPTLEQNDRLIAKMRDIGPIARGDVVIVRTGKVEYVKRVVGLPGDTFAMREGVIVLNGTPVPKNRLGEVERDFGISGLQRVVREREQFPEEAKAHEVLDLGATPQDNISPVKLGIGQYFLLGDNRDNSLDSRFEEAVGGLGVVDQQRIEGRVLFRYWRSNVGLGEGRV
ncbi:signal peptidase I [Novosphingobium sp. Chol11]|uniref:signal peptidase I n=1 Tax=Novosphingobium sp. Chol11 TaxID=1385763 RepID=UPI0025E57A88|nr:signal peptidase I [Novosphingobium sp. Chol11]